MAPRGLFLGVLGWRKYNEFTLTHQQQMRGVGGQSIASLLGTDPEDWLAHSAVTLSPRHLGVVSSKKAPTRGKVRSHFVG